MPSEPENCIPSALPGVKGVNPDLKIIHTVGLEECVRQGKAVIGWDEKYSNTKPGTKSEGKPHLRKGIGIATVMQGTAIPYLDMGGAIHQDE